MNKKVVLGFLGLIVLGITYYLISPIFIKTVANEVAPTTNTDGSSVIRKASIIDTALHPASGEVSVIRDGTNTYIRYENFKTLNGPDLFVYLANDLNATDFVNLGELRATEGNINYLVPQSVEVEKYTYVMVWCKQFGVLFNYADISGL